MKQRTVRECSVEGCTSTNYEARGFCNAHYLRWWKCGDPLAGKPARATTPRFEASRYFDETVLPYRGEACLIWPYSCDGYGYAQVNRRHASRIVCERTHGPPPSRSHQAAHSCGMGKRGCVAPSHLSWKTPLENAADKVAHGTVLRGEKAVQAKLTESDVKAIRAMAGISRRAVAKQFGVSQSLIFAVQKRFAWTHVE